MEYKDELKNIISSSGLTLREICRRAKLEGLSITPSYISQLQNGKVPPPNDEISYMIAKVCQVDDPSELVTIGYMEKAPEEIKNLFLKAFNQGLDLNNEYLKSLNLSDGDKSSLVNDERINTFRNEIIGLEPNKLTELFSKLIVGAKNSINTAYISDESMEPLIPKNAKFKYSYIEKDKLKDGDVVIVTPPNSELKYVRSYYYKDGQYYFLSENRKFPFFASSNFEDFDVWGIVESYEVNIKK